jgi:hypothetical protein
MVFSQTALRKGIPNKPDVQHVSNLKALCERVLEPIRTLIGKPIFVTSGYRSEALNAAVGGSKSSQHMEGLAADIICPSFGSARNLAEIIAVSSNIEFDQLIYEGDWVHISTSDQPRNHVLTAVFEDGTVDYRAGII